MTDWVTTTIAGINTIISQLISLPASIFQFFVSFLLALYYPVAIVIYCFQITVIILYNTFIPIVNLVINIANFPIILIQSVFVIPAPWTTVLYTMLMIIVTVKSIRWIRTIPILGKYIFATGDK